MSNILYRIQVMPQEEIQTRIIDSNEILEEYIEERRKKPKRQVVETLFDESGASEEQAERSSDFTGFDEMELTEAEPEQPEIDYVAQAQEEAEQLLTQARMQADEMIMQAESQAEAMRSHAEAEGYKDGVEQGIQEAAVKQQQMEEELAQEKSRLLADYKTKQQEMEKELVDVVCDVVEKVFSVQFGDEKQVIFHLLDNALSNIEGSRSFIIRVNEANCEYLRKHKDELTEKIGQEAVLDIVQDPLLEDSQCMIETDGGLFDCSMDTQMRNLIKKIKSLS